MFKLFRKKPETTTSLSATTNVYEIGVVESQEPETFVTPTDDMIRDYNFGLNYQQLSEKYNLSVEEVAEIIGA